MEDAGKLKGRHGRRETDGWLRHAPRQLGAHLATSLWNDGRRARRSVFQALRNPYIDKWVRESRASRGVELLDRAEGLWSRHPNFCVAEERLASSQTSMRAMPECGLPSSAGWPPHHVASARQAYARGGLCLRGGPCGNREMEAHHPAHQNCRRGNGGAHLPHRPRHGGIGAAISGPMVLGASTLENTLARVPVARVQERHPDSRRHHSQAVSHPHPRRQAGWGTRS